MFNVFLHFATLIPLSAALRLPCETFYSPCCATSLMRKSWGHKPDGAHCESDARRRSWGTAVSSWQHRRTTWASSELAKARRSWSSHASLGDADGDGPDPDEVTASLGDVDGDGLDPHGLIDYGGGLFGLPTPEPEDADLDRDGDVRAGADSVAHGIVAHDGVGSSSVAHDDVAVAIAGPICNLTHQISVGLAAIRNPKKL
eukprot:8338364-Pyramimonas_sp.AAC.1